MGKPMFENYELRPDLVEAILNMAVHLAKTDPATQRFARELLAACRATLSDGSISGAKGGGSETAPPPSMSGALQPPAHSDADG